MVGRCWRPGEAAGDRRGRPAGGACAYSLAKQGRSVLLIERGKYAGAKNVWGGTWYTYTDAGDGGTSTLVRDLGAPGANGSGHAARMRGQVTTDYRYGYIGIGTTLDTLGEPMDIRGYTAISFWMRGDGKQYRMRLESDAVQDYDYYGITFKAKSDRWRQVYIDFDDLRQEGWGKRVPWTGTDVENLSFQTVGQPHRSITLEIDNITFHK